jgi:hypothetical protein
MYPSKLGTPVITAIHPGTHQYPAKAPEVIVKFFKSQVRTAKAADTETAQAQGAAGVAK